MTFVSHPQGKTLYGRRKGPSLSPRQQALMDTKAPLYQISLDEDFQSLSLKGDSLTTWIDPEKELWLEIGFGGGEHLIHLAHAYPDRQFIGCEPFFNGIAKLVCALSEQKINNIAFFADDARLLLNALPQHSVSGAFLLYPDPWPKKRHWKRRFVQRATLDLLARILKDKGGFYCATDKPDLGLWILRHCLDHEAFVWTAKNNQDWDVPWDGWLSTRYEQKALREGRKPIYLQFQKRA
jgi:tRNA (guanine-N7-)-methyltransferase